MIDIRNVTVRYGTLNALHDMTLNIRAGEIFGYIGPTGAGKSTTMKVLACLLTATTGDAFVDGLNVREQPDKIRRRVGYMPDFLGVYPDLTVYEYLQFFAAAYRVKRSERHSIIDGVLELTDLTGKRNALVDSLSRGMQQRLGVARVLVHDPKVLLLDEPASGLDPRARIELRSLLGELRSMGKTVIISSHILSELHEICSSIGIIERGKLLYHGSIEDAFQRAHTARVIDITVADGADRAEAALLKVDGIDSVHRNGGTLTVHLGADVPADQPVIEALASSGATVKRFAPREAKLEDVFLRLTEGAVQ